MKYTLLFLLALIYCYSTSSFASLRGAKLIQENEMISSRILDTGSNSTVELESTTNTPLRWDSLRPVLERFVQETIEDPEYESRKFVFELFGQDILEFHEWMTGLMRTHGYPISFGSSQHGNGERKDGVNEKYRVKFRLRNNTLKEIAARETNEYRFFGGPLDETLVNEQTLFHLMSRIGFKKKDFEKGKTGMQGRILVKPVKLECRTLDLCLEEINQVITHTSKKAIEGHIALIFNLSEGCEFKVNALSSHIHDRNGWIGRLSWPMTIFASDENRFYLIFRNYHRQILDLHAFDKEGEFHGIYRDPGFHLVKAFIREKYDNFEKSCTVITGRGNGHPNSQGVEGVMKTAFPYWIADERIRPLVVKSTLCPDGGRFFIQLVPPFECDLRSIADPDEQINKVVTCFDDLLHADGDRLVIKTKNQEFDHEVIHLLVRGIVLAREGVTVSFTYAPEELRVTIQYEDDMSGRNLLARSDDMTTTSSDDSDDFSYRRRWKENGRIGPTITLSSQRLDQPRRIAPRPAPKGPSINPRKQGQAKEKPYKAEAKQPAKKGVANKSAPKKAIQKKPLQKVAPPKKESKLQPGKELPKKGTPPKKGDNPQPAKQHPKKTAPPKKGPNTAPKNPKKKT